MSHIPYAIGLDLGTSSTGYAMTDMNGQLLKHQKRSTFGAVLFDAAKTAAVRRGHRSARRRLDRREQRINLLQALMQTEIEKIDPDFFLRLNESFLQEDERRYPLLYGTLPVSIWTDGSPFVMPDGKPLLDANGKARTYPTIYHLRDALIRTDKQADIRYVYLAMHHIIKYRGHFLLENQSLESENTDVKKAIREALQALSDDPLNNQLNMDDTVVEEVFSLLQDQQGSRSNRADKLVSCLKPAPSSKPAVKAFANLLVGNKGSLKALCGYDDETPAEKLSLAQEDLDVEAYVNALGVHSNLFQQMVQIYRWQLFSGLREPGKTISQTMIRRYEQHQQDLKQLKKWIKTYAPGQYDAMFRQIGEKTKNYCTYTGHYKQKKLSKRIEVKACSQDDFYKAVRKCFSEAKPSEAIADAAPMRKAMEIENGFLPLLRINFNGVIPNQFHLEELEKIIDRQGQYYPTLLENKERIMSLCSFRIPYFVGPLNPASPFAKWIKRSPNGHAYPWNFYEVVDKMATAEGFIKNLTNQCTYLPGRDVLPLHALLYEEYLLLDELNRVTINGKLIGTDLKQRLIRELFMQRKNVTKKAFIKWLMENTAYGRGGEMEVDHLHGKDAFAASLRSYHDFVSHGFVINEDTSPMIETLIRWSTIFENRGILREKIEASYPELTEAQISYVCRRRYTGWGRLSSELLDGIQGEYDHTPATIIEVMRNTNDNFMQIINQSRYGFNRLIEELQTGGSSDRPISYQDVQELPGSPALKRSVWQAARIVNELVRHQGAAPTAIYIENTREDDPQKKGKRTTDRIALLEALYADDPEVPEHCRQALAECKSREMRLNDREFLYFLQLGKCLYSGETLSFDQLHLYQIDHILPQSYIKDDSIDNRALVVSSENQRKRDDRLLSSDIQAKMGNWWRLLKKRELLSEKKFHNLTRTHISEREQLGFINRQLVETSQIIKHVTMLFKAHYPDTHVFGINARLSSAVRDAYGLVKVREINDTHHAFDAFLACTLGTFMDKYLTWISDESVAASMARECWKEADKSHDPNGIVLGYFNRDQRDHETGEVLRSASRHIAYLKAVWNYKDHFIVWRKRTDSGNFFNETRYPAGNDKAKVPLKKGLPVDRYGGFDSVSTAYIAAIAYKKGKKMTGELINVPIMLVKKYEQDPTVLIEYLRQTDPAYKRYDIQIIRRKILLNQKILYEGSELVLRSAREAWNAKQLYLSREQVLLIHQLVKQPEARWTCSEAELDALYDVMMNKLKSQYPIYYATVGGRLQNKNVRDIIKTLPGKEKGILILETLKMMQANGLFAMYKDKLPMLGLSNSQGRITNKTFDPAKITLIDQSITGFYERRTQLWDSAPF